MNIDIERLKTDAEYWDEVAPEGATHYCPEDVFHNEGWLRGNDRHAYFMHSAGTEWLPGSKIESNCIPRPAKPAAPEWSGEGLPPSGIQCECYHADLNGEKQWIECDVVGPYGDYVICAPNGGGFYGFDADELRPIRTKEQRQRDELAVEIWSLDGRSKDHAYSVADHILSRFNLEPKDD